MKAEDLYGYADRFATRHENAGEGTVYPTLRQCARRFRVTVAEVESVANEGIANGYLGVCIGLLGSGYAEFPRSEWTVEAYGR